MSLTADTGRNLRIVQESGAVVPFIANGSGGYDAPPRVLATLVRNGDGTYSFTRKASQVRYVFSPTEPPPTDHGEPPKRGGEEHL
jgi:hypothetical protein